MGTDGRAAGLALALASVLALGCADPRPRHHTVEIHAMRFVPADLTVSRGDVIEWVNQDAFPHTATAVGTFDSAAIASRGTWVYTAGQPGTFAYGCTLHPTMAGTITVR